MANTTRTEPQAFSSIGVDIGKDVFHLIGFDSNGKVVLRRKIKRLALVSTFENLPPLHCWDGGVSECPFCQSDVAQAWF